MKAEDLKTKTIDELKKLLMDLKKQQFNLRFQKSQGQTENTAEVRKIRRNVARIKTFMNEKQRAEQAKAA
ncbi:MAG: 50S ribosomal protein L29 [Rhodospirillales bacterium]|nr:50S ribosomal protein L29 [Rhodospirillales bacterium]